MADATRNNESITEVVPTVLGEHLVKTISSLKEFYPEWPSSNRRIKHPSVTIHAPSPEFSNLMPYPEALPIAGTPINAKSQINWVVGTYDFSLQVDLWARSKEERDDMFDQLFNALSPDIDPMGLRLNMKDYFNQICDYLYIGHDLGDSQEASQRDEWRMILKVSANCKAIRSRKEFIIEETQTATEIDANGEISESVVI